MKKEELWQSLLAQLQLLIPPFQFSTWFKNAEILDFYDGTVIIGVRNSFIKEWLEKKFAKTILQNLQLISPQVKNLKFEVKKENSISFEKNSKAQLDLEFLRKTKEANLNPKYTFSRFVVGSFNELAFAAASAVSRNPGKIYNPLFIYGGVGLGKTHLLQATGNEILNLKNELKVKYIQTQVFISEVIQAIKNRQIEEFRKRLQYLDVLIVDDIQFLAGKERTQEEFFYLFNMLYEKNKQIIISSDRSPREIPALAERLRSRFEGGMLADISLPDYESRLAILKEKTQEIGVLVPEKILEFIAQNIKRNIRELEGALNYLICNLNFNQKIDEEKMKIILRKFVEKPKKAINTKTIIKEVADFYGVKEKDLLSKARRSDIVKPRQVAMFLMKEELKISFNAIAEIFGGKDHTTVMYAYQKICENIQKDENFRDEIYLLKERIFS